MIFGITCFWITWCITIIFTTIFRDDDPPKKKLSLLVFSKAGKSYIFLSNSLRFHDNVLNRHILVYNKEVKSK